MQTAATKLPDSEALAGPRACGGGAHLGSSLRYLVKVHAPSQALLCPTERWPPKAREDPPAQPSPGASSAGRRDSVSLGACQGPPLCSRPLPALVLTSPPRVLWGTLRHSRKCGRLNLCPAPTIPAPWKRWELQAV